MLCNTGYVDKFLSWNAFTVLGRLTYVVYLVHYNFLAVYYAHARKPYYYTVLDRVVFYLGVVFISFSLAFLISLTVEIPLLNLEKIYIVNPSQQSKILLLYTRPILISEFVHAEDTTKKSTPTVDDSKKTFRNDSSRMPDVELNGISISDKSP